MNLFLYEGHLEVQLPLQLTFKKQDSFTCSSTTSPTPQELPLTTLLEQARQILNKNEISPDSINLGVCLEEVGLKILWQCPSS